MKYVNISEVATLEKVNKKTIERRIKAKKYRIKKVEGKGGREGKKTLIRLDDLSPRAQDRYWKLKAKEEDLEDNFLEGLTESQLKGYNRNVNIIERVLKFPRTRGRGILMGDLADEVGITYMQLTRIWNNYNKEGLKGLIPGRKGVKGARFDRRIQEKAISLFFYEGRPYVTQIYNALKIFCKENNLEIPTYFTINNFINRWEEENPADAYAHRFGIRAARQKFGTYIPRDFSYLSPNDLWMGDHSPLDILVINPENKRPDRPWITAWMDIRTRVIMGYHVSLQPSSQTIALAFKRAIFRDQYFGIPRMVYVDRGKDYKAKMFDGKIKKFRNVDLNEETLSVFQTLDISVTRALPYNARAKAQIERFFGTLERGWINLLPGYTGHNVQARPAEKLDKEIKEGKLLSFIKLKEAVADAITAYHTKPHRAFNGKAPLEVFAELWDREDLVDMKGLEYLLMKKDERVMQRDGIHINGLVYFSFDPEFGACVGKKAIVRWDPDDLRWINVSVGDLHLGKIYTAEAARWGDKEAMNKGMKIQRAQEKRWRTNMKKTTEENAEIKRLLQEGMNAEQTSVATEKPEKKILHMTGMEKKARDEETREKRKNRDKKPAREKAWRFKQGVL